MLTKMQLSNSLASYVMNNKSFKDAVKQVCMYVSKIMTSVKKAT